MSSNGDKVVMLMKNQQIPLTMLGGMSVFGSAKRTSPVPALFLGTIMATCLGEMNSYVIYVRDVGKLGRNSPPIQNSQMLVHCIR